MKITSYDLKCGSETDAASAEALIRQYRESHDFRMDVSLRFAFGTYYFEVTDPEMELPLLYPGLWAQLGTFLKEGSYVEFDSTLAISWRQHRPFLSVFMDGSWHTVREVKE